MESGLPEVLQEIRRLPNIWLTKMPGSVTMEADTVTGYERKMECLEKEKKGVTACIYSD